MLIVHLSFALTSLWLVSASDFRPGELNALLSIQNRATQQLTEESETTKVAPPEKVSFCPHFCGSASAQNGPGCCVETDGGMKSWASSNTNRDQCEKSPHPSVWCTGGQNPWPGTKGNTLMKIAGWDCKNQEGWHLGGATGVVCDLPTLVAVGVDASRFTDPPLVPTPAPTPAPTLPPAAWDLVFDGYKCTGQVFGTSASKELQGKPRPSEQTTEASQYSCEQLAIQRQHAFYQYHAGKGLCVTEESCFNRDPIVAPGWAVYRDDNLWPLKERSQSCSNKRKNIRDVSSQMECQQAALDRVKPNTNEADPATYYTWSAFAQKCRVSKKCKNKPERASFATYEIPR